MEPNNLSRRSLLGRCLSGLCGWFGLAKTTPAAAAVPALLWEMPSARPDVLGQCTTCVYDCHGNFLRQLPQTDS